MAMACSTATSMAFMAVVCVDSLTMYDEANGDNIMFLVLALILQLMVSSSMTTLFEISMNYRVGHSPAKQFFTHPPEGDAPRKYSRMLRPKATVERTLSDRLRIALPALKSLQEDPLPQYLIREFEVPEQVPKNSAELIAAAEASCADADSDQIVEAERVKHVIRARDDNIQLYCAMDTVTRNQLSKAITERLCLKCAACHTPTFVTPDNIDAQRKHTRVRHPTMTLKDCFPTLTELEDLDLVRTEFSLYLKSWYFWTRVVSAWLFAALYTGLMVFITLNWGAFLSDYMQIVYVALDFCGLNAVFVVATVHFLKVRAAAVFLQVVAERCNMRPSPDYSNATASSRQLVVLFSFLPRLRLHACRRGFLFFVLDVSARRSFRGGARARRCK